MLMLYLINNSFTLFVNLEVLSDQPYYSFDTVDGVATSSCQPFNDK